MTDATADLAAGAAAERPVARTTAWARNLDTPLRSFLRTETGSAAILLGATIAALVWVNADAGSYGRVWDAAIGIHAGGWSLDQSARAWVNDGLMTLFFLVVGLEARREFDMGELRERRRVTLPLLAGVGGMVVPVAIYLAANGGRGTAGGWGTAMSTDTAFALGMLALVGPRFPDRLRSFMLTVAVVDDLLALVVIALAYSTNVAVADLLVGIVLLAALVVASRVSFGGGVLTAALGLAAWVAMHRSGVDPVVVGLVAGLATAAYPAARGDLERASDLFRLFREQPTPELAREARAGLESSLSPNERLQLRFHPWTSYAIVPLFALANGGIAVSGSFLAHAYGSPVTLGILLGYVIGKPVGIVGVSWLVTRVSRGRLRPAVGWAAVAGGGSIAGIGFTVSLLIATLAFSGAHLEEAKLGVLTAALVASTLSWLLFSAAARLPLNLRARALLGTAEPLVDLAVPVDDEHDHIRGPEDSPVTIVEYGDFECPYCGQAEPAVRELLGEDASVRYVFRHLPLTDVHPRAQLAAEAAEAAARQGRFWEMYNLLFAHQDALSLRDLIGYAQELGLDLDRFRDDLRTHAGAPRVAEDVDSADLSSVSGTPTFFVNGRRHYGAYDLHGLKVAVKLARARAAIAA
jgi:Na+/H+ antiporter NhaA